METCQQDSSERHQLLGRSQGSIPRQTEISQDVCKMKIKNKDFFFIYIYYNNFFIFHTHTHRAVAHKIYNFCIMIMSVMLQLLN